MHKSESSIYCEYDLWALCEVLAKEKEEYKKLELLGTRCGHPNLLFHVCVLHKKFWCGSQLQLNFLGRPPFRSTSSPHNIHPNYRHPPRASYSIKSASKVHILQKKMKLALTTHMQSDDGNYDVCCFWPTAVCRHLFSWCTWSYTKYLLKHHLDLSSQQGQFDKTNY